MAGRVQLLHKRPSSLTMVPQNVVGAVPFRSGDTAGLGLAVSPRRLTAQTNPSSPTSRSAVTVSQLSSLPVNGSVEDLQLPDSAGSSRTLCPSREASGFKGGSLRSSQAMQGLLRAEMGDAMVAFDPYAGGNGFRDGQCIEPASMTPAVRPAPTRSRARSFTLVDGPHLSRKSTLMSTSAPPARKAAELKCLLGNANAKLKSGATVLHPDDMSALHTKSKRRKGADALALERAKSRARVEVDLALSSDSFVQGQLLSGHLLVRVRKCSKKQSPILLSGGKLRVIGFECIPDGGGQRHIFYQCTGHFPDISYASEQIYADGPEEGDGGGYRRARDGTHVLPFEMELPVDSTNGSAKGVADIHGSAVRYIALVSIKVKDPDSMKCSLAHFYRFCSIWPQLSLETLFTPAPRPLVSTAAKSPFLGSSRNKLKLTARLPRLWYLSGQRCYVHIRIDNETKRDVLGVSITLFRTTTTYRPRAELNMRGRGDDHDMDPDACQTNTLVREVAESKLEMGERGTKGRASAKGWWTGAAPGDEAEFSHYILIPPDELSIPRSRLLAVDYNLRVTVTAPSGAPGFRTDVSVMLPVRIASMLSVDAPPSLCLPPEALTVNRYCKAIDADQHVPTRAHANAGTPPSYRTQPPSLASALSGPTEGHGSRMPDQPPYYTSRQNSREGDGAQQVRDRDIKERTSNPKFVVANQSPATTTASDAALSRVPVGHRPRPRSSSESDEEVQSILMENPFPSGQPYDADVDEQWEEDEVRYGEHAVGIGGREDAFVAIQRSLQTAGQTRDPRSSKAAGRARRNCFPSPVALATDAHKREHRHPEQRPRRRRADDDSPFARRVREKLANAELVKAHPARAEPPMPEKRTSGLPRPPSMANLPPSSTLPKLATDSLAPNSPSSAPVSADSGATASLPSSAFTSSSAAASVNRGLGASCPIKETPAPAPAPTRMGREEVVKVARRRPKLVSAHSAVQERILRLEEQVRVHGAY